MEDPKTWGPLEKAIADSLFKYQEAKDSGHIGWSQVKMLAEDLRNGGFIYTDDMIEDIKSNWYDAGYTDGSTQFL